MRLEKSVSGKTTLVVVEGEVVLDDAIELRQTLLGKGAERGSVIVDLTRVPYIDSAGIAVLVEGLRYIRTRGGRLLLCGLRDEARGLVEMSHLNELFETYPSREEAELALG